MPSALTVDWSAIAIQAAAGATLEELSDHWGISLNTLKTRSAREGWKQTAREIQAHKSGTTVVCPSHQSVKPRETNHGLSLMAKLGERSKLRAAKVGDNTLKAISRKKEDKLIACAPAFKATVDSLAKIHEWGAAPDQRTLVNINLMGQDYGETNVSPKG